jgi:transposase InsO family protein
MVERIRTLALEHPAYGCNRLEAMLALEGRRVSSITIQKILNETGPGTRVDRWLALEQANATKAIEITAEQAAFLEKLNPCFRERHVESAAPGELLSADTFFVGSLKGVGNVYLHAVVDTYGSYAFGFLHVAKQPEAAVAVLHNDVLPFYRNLDLPVGAILTDNGREFCGTERHPYELYLDLNGIEHRRTRVRSPKTNGFVERFNGTVLDEFFRVKMRERPSTRASRCCRPTPTLGSSTKTPRGRTSATATWDADPSRPPCHSSAKKVKWTLGQWYGCG